MMDAEQQKESLIDEYTDDALYEIATGILFHLERNHYCIWQTYDKEDIKNGLGKKPTKEKMEELQERLADTWEYIC